MKKLVKLLFICSGLVPWTIAASVPDSLQIRSVHPCPYAYRQLAPGMQPKGSLTVREEHKQLKKVKRSHKR